MFKLRSKFKPTSDQPQAIEKLTKNLRAGTKDQVLLGVTGSGKSLNFSEPVFVIDESYSARVISIGELVERELKSAENKHQQNETLSTVPKKKYQVISLNPKTLQVELKPIVSLIKHRAPSEMYSLKTSCGRNVLITGDHNFYILRNGELKLVTTNQMKTGDYIPLPRGVFYSLKKGVRKFNLLNFLENEKLWIKTDKLLQKIIKKYGRKKINNLLRKYFKSPWVKTYAILKSGKGSSLPLNIFQALYQKLNLKIKPGDLKEIELVSRKIKSKNFSLKAQFNLTQDFLKLIGYYIAEGNSSQRDCFRLTNTDCRVRKEIKRILQTLKWPYGIQKGGLKDIIIYGYVFHIFLKKLCGPKAGDKKLPNFWPNLSSRQLSILLQTYFEGDGWAEGGQVLSVTKSKQLASDLSYALSRWGIWARVREINKRAYNSKQKLTKYFEVSISSQDNLRLFAENIGFRFPKKNKQLEKQLHHTPHSNVDIIPGCGNLLKETRQALHVYTTQLGKKTNLTHSIISMFESGKRNPTRKTATKLINYFKKRVAEIEGLNLEYLKFWSQLTPADLKKTKKELYQLIKLKNPSVSLSELFEIYTPPSMKYFKGEPSLSTKLISKISLLAQNLKKENVALPNPLSGFTEYSFNKRAEILLKLIRTLNLPLPECKIRQRMQFETLQKLSRRYYETINTSLQKAEKNIETLEKLPKVRWTPVISINKISYPKKYVYDLAVKDNETFLAGYGGLFVHNTFTMAKVIEEIKKPTLIISPNKTLCAQLFQEFKEFFPNNSIHFFTSYYDYYQPEAYIPQTDTYIEKDAKINEEIDRLRHSATQDLLERRDVIIVASVSCIYNIGSPETYQKVSLEISHAQKIKRRDLISQLINLQYQRNDIDFKPGTFRVRGDIIDIFLVTGKKLLRVEFLGDKINKISKGEVSLSPSFKFQVLSFKIYPAHFWIAPQERLNIAIENIKLELQARLKELKKENKLLEWQRLDKRTNYDLEMLKETGFCHGIENYSRHLEFRAPGEPPFTLLDYFEFANTKHPQPSTDSNYIVFIDESHITIPQLHAMYNTDRSRKEVLIEHGFRLPSALDNRPLSFEEFEKKIKQVIYVSATPGPYEKSKIKKETKKTKQELLVEQLTRPTGLLEPSVEIKPTKNQVQDLIQEIKHRAKDKQRTLVITLTKRLAEDLSDYLSEAGIKTNYLHSEIKTLERPQILRDLRKGKYDVIVGINLLREGLDLPEVALVAILDADKEGFLRNETTLIQTMGRAARHLEGHVILYADKITKSMANAINEVRRRRKIQMEFNRKHNITPKPIIKDIRDWPFTRKKEIASEFWIIRDKKLLEKEMKTAAKNLDFERAVEIRDLIKKLKT